jgi:hypothetical protein
MVGVAVLLNDLHLSETLLKKDMFLKLAAAMECKQRGSRLHHRPEALAHPMYRVCKQTIPS